MVTSKWGYENKFDDFADNIPRCFSFPNGLPCNSAKWLNYARNNAKKLLGCLNLLENAISDGSWRIIMHHARLSLMLADHYHSSKDANKKWSTELKLYANTHRATGQLKQKLDEHLLGVAKQAVRNIHLLPVFEGKHAELQRAYDVKTLKQKSPGRFGWQDKAVARIKTWRAEQGKKLDNSHFGFFTVNMASTGTGKTFANAKIMRALSVDQESLRYILALGLRTLTLQTGDEYRHRIGLKDDELAVLIGSRAVLALHHKNNEADISVEDTLTGSNSDQPLLDNELHYDSTIPEKELATVLPDKKSRRFLYAPVLSCTIDHLMGASETKRGGRHILPTLRLMSSDLVIDEIDDFDGKDLIAIGRLIHLAGMLGRKVMISSATIPPDLAEGYFNAYQYGWSLFAKMRSRRKMVGCAWVDEFGTKVEDINPEKIDNGLRMYRKTHKAFVGRRVMRLQKQTPKRKADIYPCKLTENDEETIRHHYFSIIKKAILEKHQHHHIVDKESEKQISFGVVRVANITPCLELTRYFLNCELPKDTEIRTMAYHSQQVLIMRNEQEKHLDGVLQRKAIKPNTEQQKILAHLKNIKEQNVIFVLVATPVEEVGRDHDFDWAVVEPSSYRSFIQLAGRVLRHRELKTSLTTPNMSLLQYNLKGLLQQREQQHKPVFCRPGYESNDNPLDTHDLQHLLNAKAIGDRIDASTRISRHETLHPAENLADLEHTVIRQLLSDYTQQGPESLQGWLTGCWWLTAIPQQLVKFRERTPQLTVFLMVNDDGFCFVEKDRNGQTIPIEETYNISWREELTDKEISRLWLKRDYKTLLKDSGKTDLQKAALIYGELCLPIYKKDLNNLSFSYSHQLGLVAK